MTDRLALLVTGDRHAATHGKHKDWDSTIRKALSSLNASNHPPLIIHGDAYGIDRMVANTASKPPYYFSPIPAPAQWAEFGKSAGPRRNRAMLALLNVLENVGYETKVFAFHDDWEHSKGTRDMIMQARSAGWDVTLWKSDGSSTFLWRWRRKENG